MPEGYKHCSNKVVRIELLSSHRWLAPSLEIMTLIHLNPKLLINYVFNCNKVTSVFDQV